MVVLKNVNKVRREYGTRICIKLMGIHTCDFWNFFVTKIPLAFSHLYVLDCTFCAGPLFLGTRGKKGWDRCRNLVTWLTLMHARTFWSWCYIFHPNMCHEGVPFGHPWRVPYAIYALFSLLSNNEWKDKIIIPHPPKKMYRCLEGGPKDQTM